MADSIDEEDLTDSWRHQGLLVISDARWLTRIDCFLQNIEPYQMVQHPIKVVGVKRVEPERFRDLWQKMWKIVISLIQNPTAIHWCPTLAIFHDEQDCVHV